MLTFACDDAQATHDDFAARGVSITQAPQMMPWALQFMFADQDGNVFDVVGQALFDLFLTCT